MKPASGTCLLKKKSHYTQVVWGSHGTMVQHWAADHKVDGSSLHMQVVPGLTGAEIQDRAYVAILPCLILFL
jgi:hypothetical protein